MKLRNISDIEQKVLPHTGPAFSCAPGATTADLDPQVREELTASFPGIWEKAGVHHETQKGKKAGDK